MKKKVSYPEEDISVPMSCPVCTECYQDPRRPGHCLFGGPFVGYKEVPDNVGD